MSSKTKNTKVKNPNKKIPNKKSSRVDIAREIGSEMLQNIMLPQRVIRQIADEVGKVVTKRISIRRKKSRKTNTKIDNSVFLDTSAIIDMRVFDLAKIGALYGTFIVLESVLSELKNIADSKDSLKKERGRRAMDALDRFKRAKGIKVKILSDEVEKAVRVFLLYCVSQDISDTIYFIFFFNEMQFISFHN